MRKHLLLLTLFTFAAFTSNAQELVTGGNMEDSSAWVSIWRTDAADTGIINFNYTDSIPDAGEGGALRISGGGQAGAFIHQPVTLIGNHRYSWDAAFANIAEDTIENTWVELILSTTMPVASTDFGPGDGDYRMQMNTWFAADTLNYDGMLSDRFEFDGGLDPTGFVIPEDAPADWYIVVKAGCWNTANDPDPTFDFVFDDVTLFDHGANTIFNVENIVVGSVDNADDFTATIDMTYDADSVYMTYDIVDDSIVNEGASYQVDNIEIYFDMDNSKNVHFPRNGGWQKPIDDAYDTNDFQLRLVPDVEFSVNNSSRPGGASISGGYRQVYTETANGYQFILNIVWDSLLEGFDTSVDTIIGFDVLISDNDAVASDANRNQITWNSPTDKPFNDPSLFGTLKLSSENAFVAVPDNEKPTDPTNLAADDSTLTWDAATDNIAVLQYILYNGNSAVDTLYAKETGNTYTFSGLGLGEHTLGVVAIDNSGNKSAKATVVVTIEESGVDKNYASFTKVYPNPSNGVFNVLTEGYTDVNIVVYNIAGKEVVNDVFNEKYSFKLTETGVYFVHLNNGNEVETVKIIVR